MQSLVRDVLNIFYPETCVGCQRALSMGESDICTHCRSHLPVAYFDLKNNDKMRELFHARIAVEQVTSLLYYEKIGTVQRLVHALKYQNQEHISKLLGDWMASYIKDDSRFADVGVVVPVPVHAKRLKKRGYNQVTGFGKSIASALQVDFADGTLVKTRNTKKQAQLNQRERSDESRSPYLLHQPPLAGQHVLLVDDVVTTGTTLTLCARELVKVPNTRISIVTMGISV